MKMNAWIASTIAICFLSSCASKDKVVSLLKKIEPAVRLVKSTTPNFDPNSYEHIDHVAEQNVKLTVERIRAKSKIIRDLEAKNQIRLVGAMYDISSGKVNFIEDSRLDMRKVGGL